MKLISSRANPTFKGLKAVAEDTREQRRLGVTLLEGIHLIAAYRDKIGLPAELIVSEHGAEQEEIRELVESMAEVPGVLLRDALYRELSGLASPTGIAAIIPIPALPIESVCGSCVLLDAVQDGGNVGSILRSAVAAGIADVFLGPGCAGVWTPRVLRAAQGAHFDLRLHEQTDLTAILAAYSGTTVAATAHGDASIYRLDLTGRIAWLFGSEGRGLSPLLEDAVHKRVTIPLAPGCESLNVAAAAAICLFEEVRQKKALSN